MSVDKRREGGQRFIGRHVPVVDDVDDGIHVPFLGVLKVGLCRTVQTVDMCVALLRHNLSLAIGNMFYIVVPVTEAVRNAHSIRVEEVVGGTAKGHEICQRVVVMLYPHRGTCPIQLARSAKPTAGVDGLPQVKKPIDVAVVQPEDGVECRHRDGAHVPTAPDDVTAANVVLFKRFETCVSTRRSLDETESLTWTLLWIDSRERYPLASTSPLGLCLVEAKCSY